MLIKRKIKSNGIRFGVELQLTEEETRNCYDEIYIQKQIDTAKTVVEEYINKNNAKLTIGDVNKLASSYKELIGLFAEYKDINIPDKQTWIKCINILLGGNDYETNEEKLDINKSSEWEKDKIRFDRGYS